MLANRCDFATVAALMPQDSPQQATIRGVLRRFPNDIPTDFTDHQLTLSGLEIAEIRVVLEDFIRVPAEPSPGDPPR